MVVDDNESTATKHAGELLAISIAMAMQRYDAGRIAHGAHPGLRSNSLDAAIGQLRAPYCPIGRHGRLIQMKHTKH